MTREEKDQVINTLAEKLAASNIFYIADTSTLTVEKTNQLRRMCFKKGIKVEVVKNTLIRKAMERSGKDYSELFDTLKGASALMFCDVANQPAKVIREFRKKDDKPKLKGAYILSDVYIGDNQLNTLADLKSKEDLIAEIIALLQSPAKNVIGALQSGKNKLAGIVKTLSEKE